MRFRCFIISIAIVANACQNSRKWEPTEKNWLYISCSKVNEWPVSKEDSIRDTLIEIENPVKIDLKDSINPATNKTNIILAHRIVLNTRFITSTMETAAMPESRGISFPVIMDEKMELVYLSIEPGQILATNAVRTRKIAIKFW